MYTSYSEAALNEASTNETSFYFTSIFEAAQNATSVDYSLYV